MNNFNENNENTFSNDLSLNDYIAISEYILEKYLLF